jgi:hypothetical protein
VITANLCWRVGVNDPSNGAYWSPLATGSSLSKSAVCCSP